MRLCIAHSRRARSLRMFLSIQPVALSDSSPRKVQLPARQMAERFIPSMIRYSQSLSRENLLTAKGYDYDRVARGEFTKLHKWQRDTAIQ